MDPQAALDRQLSLAHSVQGKRRSGVRPDQDEIVELLQSVLDYSGWRARGGFAAKAPSSSCARDLAGLHVVRLQVATALIAKADAGSVLELADVDLALKAVLGGDPEDRPRRVTLRATRLRRRDANGSSQQLFSFMA